MGVLSLPARFTEIVVVADADPSGQGVNAGTALVRRLRNEGREARLIRPTSCKDANEVLIRRPA
jgi:hypothetical protein